MKYFPILQELFESDTVLFLIIGAAAALVAGLWLKQRKKCILGLVISVAVYFVCELLSNVRTNYLLELLLLFVGTAAIGCCIGFLISLLTNLIRGWESTSQ